MATRIALYCAANEAMSEDVVPGMPLASDAPGAPAVDPPIAAGQVGVGVGVGVEVGAGTAVTGAGVVVKVRPETVALADVADTVVVVGAAVLATAVVVAVVVFVVVETAAGAALPPRRLVSAAELALDATVLATISPAARVGETWTDGPAP